ncbi:NAD-dependent epimerase/dehydratase family protein [Curtobacterium sp. Leaf261]|uniref:NAD-dependent epimerase/dehydratase family protein n=1 Tax=Curtobacterium sp. Leaf261 TaxID=1736311 RepID=UPI0006FBB5D7|nr:NAD-dependent epimerase/dehydratase family protein [Curtobacterium sp. Leaf261]KQO62176.1 hypothetical protein ASF23_10120 [Curtobacterium sp. Leaf261]
MTRATALVVGGGGFLGRAVAGALRAAGTEVSVPTVPWASPADAAATLVEAVRAIRSHGSPWRLVWCAGVGIVDTGADAFEAEAALLDEVLDATSMPAGGPDSDGVVFFASSAGAVYAGSAEAPFDESTTPVPLAPYGRTRLRAEERFATWCTETGAALLVGRIANLYGPGANLSKPQGLVSQLALAHVEHRPFTVWVPPETTRDYLYIDDAAAMVVAAIDMVARRRDHTPTTKIFAAQQGRTITDVVDAVTRAVGAPLDVRTGTSATASVHGRDLRFRSTILPAVDDRTLVAFDDGVRRTVDAIRARHVR